MYIAPTFLCFVSSNKLMMGFDVAKLIFKEEISRGYLLNALVDRKIPVKKEVVRWLFFSFNEH